MPLLDLMDEHGGGVAGVLMTTLHERHVTQHVKCHIDGILPPKISRYFTLYREDMR